MTREELAADIAASLDPHELRELAAAAVLLVLAEEQSLSDLEHRAHVHGIIAGAAPTFSRALKSTLKIARRTRVRLQPLHRHG